MNLPGDEQGSRQSRRRVQLLMVIALSIVLFLAGASMFIWMVFTNQDTEVETTAEATPTITPRTLQEGPPETPTPMSTPGLVIYGQVKDMNEAGVAGVNIYRSYANYPGELQATTDANGYYLTDFYPIPGDEMIMLYAELSGYKFEPEYYYWRHYHGYEITQHDFFVFSP